jgi:hypothetical protein
MPEHSPENLRMAGSSRNSNEKQYTHVQAKEKYQGRNDSQWFLTLHFRAVYKAEQEFMIASTERLRAAKRRTEGVRTQ